MAEAGEAPDRKAQELMEETNSDSRTIVYTGVMDTVITVVLAGFAVFQLWANLTGSLGAVRLRAAHIMILLPLAFLLYPTRKAERRKRSFPPVWDVGLCIAAVF